MFIVIDWIDWSWKGTQILLVSEELKKLWKRVKMLDYPRYWEKSAFMVEKYLNWEYWKEVNPKLSSIFYAIDRFEDYSEYQKDLQNYDYIISNRYVSSSMIHQSWKIDNLEEKEKFIDWLYDLEYNIFWIPKPDKIIFLNVSPQTSRELVKNKEKRDYIKNDKNVDLHEEDENHINNAYKSIIQVVNKFDNCKIVNCEDNGKILEKDKITKMILKEIL